MERTKEWWLSKARNEEGCESVGAGQRDRILKLWTITENPSDYPGMFVARLHVIHYGGFSGTTDQVMTDVSIFSLRDRLIAEKGVSHPLPRDPSDDPVIVETWM